MFVTRCASTGIGMYIHSQSRLTTVLLDSQLESTTAIHNSRDSERKWLFHITQRNLQHYNH